MTAFAYARDRANHPNLLSCDDASVSNASHSSLVPAPVTENTTGKRNCGKRGSSSSFRDDTTSSGDKCRKRSRGVKRVHWDRIHTREFVLVVGDHPLCEDGLPVTLGWQYTDKSFSPPISNTIGDDQSENNENRSSPQRQEQQQIKISERRQSYVFPRRLSYEERKERLVSISNLTLEQIKSDEMDLVVRTLEESWANDDIYSGEYNEDMTMDLNPIGDEKLLELDDIDAVPNIEIDSKHQDDEDFGDVSHFVWSNEETGI